MDDFAAKPGVPNMFKLIQGEANSIAPGKTPLSSMTPTIVLRGGKLYMALGAPGGGPRPQAPPPASRGFPRKRRRRVAR